jgi:hypothetical protein
LLAATPPLEAFVLDALDALVVALYVQIDDFLEPRRGPGVRRN